MRRMRRLLSILLLGSITLLVGITGCGDTPPAEPMSEDAGLSSDAGDAMDGSLPNDGGEGSGTDAGTEADGGEADAGIEPDAGSEPDAGVEADAGIEPDAGLLPDAGSTGALGPVQCRSDADCPGSAMICNTTAPGGVCWGCKKNSDCPTGTTCATDVEGCVRGCSSDADCSAGLRCIEGECLARICPCPAGYACGMDNRCERPRCSGGTCPDGFECRAGTCMEL